MWLRFSQAHKVKKQNAYSHSASMKEGICAFRNISPRWLVIPTSPTSVTPSPVSLILSSNSRRDSSPSSTLKRRYDWASPGNIVRPELMDAPLWSWTIQACFPSYTHSRRTGPNISAALLYKSFTDLVTISGIAVLRVLPIINSSPYPWVPSIVRVCSAVEISPPEYAAFTPA